MLPLTRAPLIRPALTSVRAYSHFNKGVHAHASTHGRTHGHGHVHGTSRRRGMASVTALSLSTAMSAVLGYVLGAKFPPPTIPFLFTPYMKPEEELTPAQAEEHTRMIELGLHELPAVRDLLPMAYESPSARKIREKYGVQYDIPLAESIEEADFLVVRPFVNTPPGGLDQQFTAGSLRGPHKFATIPLIFSLTKKGAERRGGRGGDGLAFLHLGKNMCGFENVIHGGLVATIFDEALARTAFYALPNMVGVTGKLEVDYRKPVVANQYAVLQTNITENIGRKAFVRGELRPANADTVLAHASSIFIEPRWAKYASWVGGVNVKKHLEQ